MMHAMKAFSPGEVVGLGPIPKAQPGEARPEAPGADRALRDRLPPGRCDPHMRNSGLSDLLP